jgi:hypothetical protein
MCWGLFNSANSPGQARGTIVLSRCNLMQCIRPPPLLNRRRMTSPEKKSLRSARRSLFYRAVVCFLNTCSLLRSRDADPARHPSAAHGWSIDVTPRAFPAASNAAIEFYRAGYLDLLSVSFSHVPGGILTCPAGRCTRDYDCCSRVSCIFSKRCKNTCFTGSQTRKLRPSPARNCLEHALHGMVAWPH